MLKKILIVSLFFPCLSYAREPIVDVGLRAYDAFRCVVAASASKDSDAQKYSDRLLALGMESSRQFYDRVIQTSKNPNSEDSKVTTDQIPLGLLEAMGASNGNRDFFAGRLFQIATDSIIEAGYKEIPFGRTEYRTFEQVKRDRENWYLNKFREQNCTSLR